MDRIYCQHCWLFSYEKVSPWDFLRTSKPWGTTGLNDWRYLWQRILSHESSTHHTEACVIYEQSRNRTTIEEALHESLLAKCFGKANECYVDISKVQLRLTFRESMQ